MNDDEPSHTALTAALMRAVHTRLDRPRLIDDAWGDRLVSAEHKAALHRRALQGTKPEARRRLTRLSQDGIVDAVLRCHAAYGSVILRSRYAEDALEHAVARGARQYVLIGAGFDSFIVRQPESARDIDIFEIDHPKSQALKRQRLEEYGVWLPPNVHFVPADLARESLASVLARYKFLSKPKTFFSWLGVTVYLSREANLATLRGVAASSATGSEIAFTYIDQQALEGARSKMRARMQASRGTLREPWLSGFDPATLATELKQRGLLLVEDLGSLQLRERYCAGRTDGLLPGASGHIALARVSAD